MFGFHVLHHGGQLSLLVLLGRRQSHHVAPLALLVVQSSIQIDLDAKIIVSLKVFEMELRTSFSKAAICSVSLTFSRRLWIKSASARSRRCLRDCISTCSLAASCLLCLSVRSFIICRAEICCSRAPFSAPETPMSDWSEAETGDAFRALSYTVCTTRSVALKTIWVSEQSERIKRVEKCKIRSYRFCSAFPSWCPPPAPVFAPTLAEVPCSLFAACPAPVATCCWCPIARPSRFVVALLVGWIFSRLFRAPLPLFCSKKKTATLFVSGKSFSLFPKGLSDKIY